MHWKDFRTRPIPRKLTAVYDYNPAFIIRPLVQADIEQLGLGVFMQKYGRRQTVYDAVADARYGELWEVDIPQDRPVMAVRVHDPYGEQKEYWLRVPPFLSSAKAAVAWTFNMVGDEYNPIVES